MVAWQTWMTKLALLVLIHRCGGGRGDTGRENDKLCVPNFVSRSFSVPNFVSRSFSECFLAEAFASDPLAGGYYGKHHTYHLSEPWTIGCLRNDAAVHSDKEQ